MAFQLPGLQPDPRCPECGGRIDTLHRSNSGLLAGVVLSDITLGLLASLFTITGFFWNLAWLAAVCLFVYVIVRRGMREPMYSCTGCKREFTYKAIHGTRQSAT